MKQVLLALKAIVEFGTEPAAIAGKVLITTGCVVGGLKIYNAASEKVGKGIKYLLKKGNSIFSSGNAKEKIKSTSKALKTSTKKTK